MYTEDLNTQMVLELLKEYGIKKIVVSPGTANVAITISVQHDPWFEVYSVIDERSAAYFATGLAFESGEPVALSCTGATASRNYLSAMTEAFYRKLPIVAITSQHHTSDYRNLVPQITDRRVSQSDVKKISVDLPFIKDNEDEEACEILINDALTQCLIHGGGPVHINLPTDPTYKFSKKSARKKFNKIDYYDSQSLYKEQSELKSILDNKKIGIFIGSHKKFSKELHDSINSFVKTNNVVVFVDHTSNYKGDNKILTGQIFDLLSSNDMPDILIDMGGITGDYSAMGLGGSKEVWRISEDGATHKRFRNSILSKLFFVQEHLFFSALSKKKNDKNNYYKDLIREINKINYPDLNLSGTYIASILAKKIPKNSSLHLGILNGLRNMNLFSLDSSIDVNSNVGGFGIDGPVSTLIGQSMHDDKKLYYGLIGDLAFFYDMNALGIRHIKPNLRILLVNNGQGAEFRLNLTYEETLGSALDSLVSAKGHNGSAKDWAKSMGFKYISASTKRGFSERIDEFCSDDINKFDKPVLFEIFTDVVDEQVAYDLIRDQRE